MSENEKKVPKRRFKEFEDAEGWEQRELGKLADVYDGTHQTPNYTDSGVMFLSVENIKTLQSEKFISEEDFEKDFAIFPEKGDVLMTRIGDIGTANVVESDAPKAYYVSLALLKQKELNPYFLRESISSKAVKKELWKRTLHIAFPKKINKNEIANVIIPYPVSEAEQLRIGELFRNFSNLITLHQRKLEKMKALRKAYFTDMFPAEGERKPKLRFAGFTDDWEERKVKEICSISTGKSNTQDKIENGEYPFYVRSPIIERSNRYLYDEEAVLTVGDGVGTGKVFHYVNGKYDLHQRVYRMFDFYNGVSGKYFYYYFSTYFYKRVMSMTAKTSVDSVRYEMISEMDIKYPSEQEQHQIVDTLERLGNLITIHQRKLEKLQNIKKAYLNEMFI